jgi:hypothetical protein
MAEQTRQSTYAKGGAAEIARLNDWLLEHLTAPGNTRVVNTSGIADLIGDVTLFRNFRKRAELLRAVRDFDAYDDAIVPSASTTWAGSCSRAPTATGKSTTTITTCPQVRMILPILG